MDPRGERQETRGARRVRPELADVPRDPQHAGRDRKGVGAGGGPRRHRQQHAIEHRSGQKADQVQEI